MGENGAEEATVTVHVVSRDGGNHYDLEFWDNEGDYSSLNGKTFEEVFSSGEYCIKFPEKEGYTFTGYKSLISSTKNILLTRDVETGEIDVTQDIIEKSLYHAQFVDDIYPTLELSSIQSSDRQNQVLKVRAIDMGSGIKGIYIGRTEPTQELIDSGAITFTQTDTRQLISQYFISDSGNVWVAVIDGYGNWVSEMTDYSRITVVPQ